MRPPREDHPMLTNVDVVVYALVELGGAGRAVHSEDVAARSFALCPSRFSWRLPQYREKGWPDKYIVKTALEDAKKEEFGILVEGLYALDLAKDGWRLTSNGAKWYESNSKRVGEELQRSVAAVSRLDVQRFIREVEGQPLYQKNAREADWDRTTIYEIADFLSCSADSPLDVLTKRLDQLLAKARIIGEVGLISFLDSCSSRLTELARGKKQGGRP